MSVFNFKNSFILAACAATLFTSCKKDDEIKGGETLQHHFHLAMASGSGSNSATLLQGRDDLSVGDITFDGRKGYQLPSTRTARIFASADGSTIYNVDYPVGTLQKFTYTGGDNYVAGTSIDASILLGQKALRPTKLSETEASLHYIASTPQVENDEYIGHKMIISAGIINLNTFDFGTNYKKDAIVPFPEDLAKEGYYISRIDCPIISGNKIYYGANINKYDANTATQKATEKTFTIVFDYPSLNNMKLIQYPEDLGSNNGYRTQTQYLNEAGDILQMVSTDESIQILKIKNGQYLDYKFDITGKLGKRGASNGWFYVGNGIGYMPYEKVDEAHLDGNENIDSAPWGLLRLDFNTEAVTEMETPDKLWLHQYQNAVWRDGKFYIALTPVGEQGYIYIYDIASGNPVGTKGAKIKAGADQYYIGIY